MVTEMKPLVSWVPLVSKFAYDWKLPTSGQLYDQIIGANGVFIRARRPSLDVCFPIVEASFRGLLEVHTYVESDLPKVPATYLQKILDLSIEACVENGSPIEALFHLRWLDDEKRWRLDQPEAKATSVSVKPVDDSPGSSYDLALIEVHSHHEMTPAFSPIDDADEQGFRIYGVIGHIFTTPTFRVRVGCYGHFFELPASEIFELPATVQDALDSVEEEEFNGDS